MAMPVTLKSLKDAAAAAFSVVCTAYASGLATAHFLVVNNGSNAAVECGYANPLPVIGCFANGTMTDGSGSIAVVNTSQDVFLANANRSWFYFQNNSDTDMWINFGAAATESQPSIKIPAGGSFTLGDGGPCSTEAIHVICTANSKTYTAKEL